MKQNTLIAVLAVAVIAYLVWRRQQGLQPLNPESENTNDLVLSPAERTQYWSVHASGDPSTAGSQGAGQVTPGTLTQWLGRVFGGSVSPWGAPNAATNPQLQLPAGPPGAFVPPGPTPPQQPTPQSAVQSTSPYLPDNLRLAAPVSSSAWAQALSFNDPYAVLLAGGDFIDVQLEPSSVLTPTKA